MNKWKFDLVPAGKSEVELFYSNEGRDKELGCVGHMRADFGSSGIEFWHSWWPHQNDQLNTQQFKEELAEVISSFRDDGPLKNRTSMAKLCYDNPDARIAGCSTPNVCGFKTGSENYWFYIRCNPMRGDYNAYVYCYDKETLNMALSDDEPVQGQAMSQ